MAIHISNAAAKAACDSIVDLFDGGSGPATLVIYNGTRPVDADTAIVAQTVLVTFTLADPAFGSAVDANGGGTATANAVNPVVATATGTAQFFRCFDSNGVSILDGSVSDTSGTGDLKLSSVSILAGIDVTVVSLTCTMPEGV